MKYKQIKVPEDLHWELKKLAAQKKLTLIQLLTLLFNDKRDGNN